MLWGTFFTHAVRVVSGLPPATGTSPIPYTETVTLWLMAISATDKGERENAQRESKSQPTLAN